MENRPSLEELLRDRSLPANEAYVASEASGTPILESLFLLPADSPGEGSLHEDGNNLPSETDAVPVASLAQETRDAVDTQGPPRLVFVDEKTGSTYGDARAAPLGEGAYGAVYEVEDEQGGRHALKVSKPTVRRAMIEKEAAFLWRVKGHKNIAEILEEVSAAQGLCLLMQLYSTQDFFQVVLKRAPLSEDHVRFFGKQLASGLKFIHEAGIIHCDLKPQNILVAAGMQLKISDFGLSEDLEVASKRRSHRRAGTPGYWAPEVVMRKAHTSKLDVFSLGVIYYNMFTRKMPTPALTDIESAYRPQAGYLDHLEISSLARDLLGRCLSFDLPERADTSTVVEHSFFRAGACPATLSDDFIDGPSASATNGVKHSRSDSAQEAKAEAGKRPRGSQHQDQAQQLHVKIIRSFKVRPAAKENEWKEILEQVEQERAAMQVKGDELQEIFGSDFGKVGTKDED
ncbi:Serine/threonine-protein kinase plk2 [Linnemannia zychae]|nr:Serine/threonine-protein kinase plk2 [Linnemannia zychae]